MVDTIDLKDMLNEEYLEGDSVSLNLQIRHLSNCYLRPVLVPTLRFEDTTEAWVGRLPAWASRLHTQAHVIESLCLSPMDR